MKRLLLLAAKHLASTRSGYRIALLSVLVFSAAGSAFALMAPGYSARAYSLRLPEPVVSACAAAGCAQAPSLKLVVAAASSELLGMTFWFSALLSLPLFLLSFSAGFAGSQSENLAPLLLSLGLDEKRVAAIYAGPLLLLSLAASVSGSGAGLIVTGLLSSALSSAGMPYVRPEATALLVSPVLCSALSGWAGALAGFAVGCRARC